VSLAVAVGGAAACHLGLQGGPFAGASWLRIVAAGFEAATIGGFADWFAVTALFRHPLGLPIPHTAIIPTRRAKIIEGIVTMVEEDWLSPDVISTRLARIAPSTLVADWLRDPTHVERVSAPVRDVLRGLAPTLSGPQAVGFLERTLRRQLRELPVDAAAGAWLRRAVASDGARTAFATIALSLANLAERPRTATQLHWWLDRSARTLRAGGRRLIPFVLRRRFVQRQLVEAACGYAAAELRAAAGDPQHPLRQALQGALLRFAERLERGDAKALADVDWLRTAVVERLEAGPLVRDALGRLRAQLEQDLDDPHGALAALIDRWLRSAAVDRLGEPQRRAAFDRWVRRTADELLRRYHHEIGRTVRENLEALETGRLVAQIE